MRTEANPHCGMQATTTDDRLIPRREVEQLVGLKHSSLYKLMRSGAFPLPLKIGHAVRWRLSEVQSWVSSLPRARGKRAA